MCKGVGADIGAWARGGRGTYQTHVVGHEEDDEEETLHRDVDGRVDGYEGAGHEEKRDEDLKRGERGETG